MAMTSKNREIAEKLDLALYLYNEYGYDPFNDFETKRKGEKVSVVVNGNLFDNDPFDVIEDLLGDEAKEVFAAEHLARHDEGKPIPPDVKELFDTLRGFVENARYMVWTAKEANAYNTDNFGTLEYLINVADDWVYMIGEYYPIGMEQRKDGRAAERPVEIVELFNDKKERCNEFFDVPNDHDPAWWARRTAEFQDSEVLDVKPRGAKVKLWSQIANEHPGIKDGLNAFRQWLKENGVKSK